MATWKAECDKRGLKPWNEVESLVNRLENEFGRGLNDSFTELWSSDFSVWWNKECIFSITSSGGSSGHGGIEFPGVILENQGWGYFNGWGQFKASYDIVAEMEKDNWQTDEAGKPIRNERLAKSVWQYGDYMVFFGDPRVYWSATDAESCLAVKKYYDAFKHKDPIANGYVHESGDGLTTRINYHLLRFGDVPRRSTIHQGECGDRHCADSDDVGGALCEEGCYPCALAEYDSDDGDCGGDRLCELCGDSDSLQCGHPNGSELARQCVLAEVLPQPRAIRRYTIVLRTDLQCAC